VEAAVRRTHRTLAGLLRHEHAPLALAQRCSGVVAPAPLFSALFNYRHSREGNEGTNPAVWEGIDLLHGEERSNYPLGVSVDDLGEGFFLTAQTLPEIGAERLCAYLETATEHLVAALEISPATAVRELAVLPEAERHQVLALDGPQAYTPAMPVFKDLASPGMLYARSYGGRQMLVSEGLPGQALSDTDDRQGEVSMDTVAEIGAQVAQRFPSFAEAGLASSWTGVYDVTPDWNPVLGPLPELPGLVVGYGFSGHGFKFASVVGEILADLATEGRTRHPIDFLSPGRVA
jgi:hypothetical protein